MGTPRWSPHEKLSKQEQFVVGRLKRTGKLFAFLRAERRVLFDEAFQQELESMYRATGEGKVPVAPALLAMVVVLQAYTGASDAEAVEHSILDARWQLVLDTGGRKRPAFSQGALQAFRERLVAHDMDRRLLERTIEIARQTAAFDWKKLPRQLRVAIDSRPLVGAGRVEDTINLLAHAARKVLSCAAELSDTTPVRLAAKAGVPMLAHKSIKAALDIEWSVPAEKSSAIVTLVEQLDRLEAWVRRELAGEIDELPLSEHLATLAQLRAQDLDPEPPGGTPRIRKGVAEDRRVSVEDPDMRHGRKSKSKRTPAAVIRALLCHRPGGRGLDLRFTTSLADTKACGVPQLGDLGVTGAMVIAPGSPSASFCPCAHTCWARAGRRRSPPESWTRRALRRRRLDQRHRDVPVTYEAYDL
jgi:hypothetical protein